MRIASLGFLIGILSIAEGNSQPGVSGQVVDVETGQVITDAIVSLIHVNDPRFPQLRADVPVSIPVDSTGSFYFGQELIERIESREVLLVARARGYGFSAKRLSKTTLPGHYVLSLRQLVAVSGVVRTADGVPIPEAAVGIVYEDPVLRNSSALSSWQYRGVYTGGDGSFATHVAFGYSFAVEASHSDYLPAVSSLMKVSSSSPFVPPVELRLADGAEVSGRIVDDAGRGLGGIKVRLFSNFPLPYAQSRAFAKKLHQEVETAADGTFSFRGVFLGKNQLLVTDRRGLPLTRRTLDLTSDRRDLLISLP